MTTVIGDMSVSRTYEKESDAPRVWFFRGQLLQDWVEKRHSLAKRRLQSSRRKTPCAWESDSSFFANVSQKDHVSQNSPTTKPSNMRSICSGHMYCRYVEAIYRRVFSEQTREKTRFYTS